MRHIYRPLCLISAHELICICGMYVTFVVHSSCGTCMPVIDIVDGCILGHVCKKC